jgi:hypothetical protein
MRHRPNKHCDDTVRAPPCHPLPPLRTRLTAQNYILKSITQGVIWGGANLASCILIQLIESAPLEWEFGIVYSQHTLFGILLLTLPPSHSYTHRTRSASPVLHDRSRVLFTPKKNFFLVVSGN